MYFLHFEEQIKFSKFEKKNTTTCQIFPLCNYTKNIHVIFGLMKDSDLDDFKYNVKVIIP